MSTPLPRPASQNYHDPASPPSGPRVADATPRPLQNSMTSTRGETRRQVLDNSLVPERSPAMMTRLMAALVLASLVAGGALFTASPVVGQEQEQEPQEAKRQPLVSLSGADSKLDRGYYRLTSAEHFTEIYMRHLGHDPADFDAYHNPHGVPMINFDECMVVAVFQGEDWNSAGVIVD